MTLSRVACPIVHVLFISLSGLEWVLNILLFDWMPGNRKIIAVMGRVGKNKSSTKIYLGDSESKKGDLKEDNHKIELLLLSKFGYHR